MDIVLKSLASAAVTAIILVVAKFSGPKMAGALGGIPIIFVVSYIFLTMQDRSGARQFLVGGVYGAIAAVFFSVLLIWLNVHFLKTHWINLVVAYIACFLLAFILASVGKK